MPRTPTNNGPPFLLLEGTGPTVVLSESVAVAPGQGVFVTVCVPRYYFPNGTGFPGEVCGATWTVTVGDQSFTWKESQVSSVTLSGDNSAAIDQLFGVTNWRQLVFPTPGAALSVSVAVTMNSNTQCGIAAGAGQLVCDVS
jgi:hypothetical protein